MRRKIRIIIKEIKNYIFNKKTTRKEEKRNGRKNIKKRIINIR